MNIVPDRLTIVLAGNFNPTILTPQWIARNGLGYQPQQEFQVELLTPVGMGGVPRFSFDGVSYAPSFQNVTFFLGSLDAAGRERISGLVGRLLALLPHTPVQGVGFNFGFTVPAPSAALLHLFQGSENLAGAFAGGAEVVSKGWSHTVSWEDAVVAFQCQLEANVVSIDANFHHTVANAEEGRAVFAAPDTYAKHYEAAVAAAQAVAGEQLEQT